ncbi:MAG: aldose 1-epimerase [Nanoarchaeota archaeon]
MQKFRIALSNFGEYEEYIIKNNETKEFVKIVSGFGCNVRELVLSANYGLHQIIHGHNVPARLKKKYSKCAMLCPFTGRIPEGKYNFNNKKYNLRINKETENTAIHGLVYNQKFYFVGKQIQEKSASLVLGFDISPGKFKGYPFSLYIEKKFTLSEKGLAVSTYAINTGTEQLPFGDGWHPHFSFGDKIEDNELSVPAKEYFRNNNKKVVTSPAKISENKRNDPNGTIGKKSFDTCYTSITRKKGAAEAHLMNEELDLVLRLGKEYNYLQIYTPDNRKTIALEPMTCPSNSFNNGIGLIVLEPSKEFKGSYSVSLKPRKK